MAEGNGMQVFLLDNANSHGLTNRFSSALAVYLNQGKKMEDALAMAQDFINVELTRESNLQDAVRNSIISLSLRSTTSAAPIVMCISMQTS